MAAPGDSSLTSGVVGVLLAGGRSSRMGGGDKSLQVLGGQTMMARTIARAAPQVEALALNANGDPVRFVSSGLPVIADSIQDFAGPLAGILAGLEWAATQRPRPRWLASFATDAPFFPRDLVARLVKAAEAEGADLACAVSGGRAHPVFGLWPLRLEDDLRRALGEGMRKVDLWTARYRVASVTFDDRPVDPFFNINRPEDLAEAERKLPLS